MITWNYRIFREDDGEFVVRKVFYAPDGTILDCTADPVEPVGHTQEELTQALDDFTKALAFPVLTLHMLPAPRIIQKERLAQHCLSIAEAATLLNL